MDYDSIEELEAIVAATPDAIVLPADPNDPEDFDVTAYNMLKSLRQRQFRLIRTSLGLSQQGLADALSVSVGTVRDWEQQRVMIPKPMLALARLLTTHPKEVANALAA